MVSGRTARTEVGWAGGKDGVVDGFRTSAKIVKIAGVLILTYFHILNILIL